MKFNRILEQYVKESEALTKIMLKVDPANSVNRDYRDLDGYEGYILKESDNIWSVLFENIDIPIMDVPFSVIQVVDIPCDETFNSVKLLGLKAIEERKGLTMEIMSKIQACNSIDFLEQYLKEEGLNDSEIKDVYKKALLSGTVNENMLKAVGTGFKVAKNLLQPDYFVAGLINKGKGAVQKKYRKKKAEIKGNIKKAFGFDEPGEEDQDQNKDKNNLQNKTGIIEPAFRREIALKVDNATPTSYDASSELITYINSNNIPYNVYKSYKDSNNNIRYYHNTTTNDIIKITPTTDPRTYNIRFGNLYSAAPDPVKSKEYFEKVFPSELAANNIRFHNKSLADFT